jgi:hypothetical protein
MPTFTTNYNLPKPNVNSAADEDLWGGQLNDGMDLIDAQLKTNADAAVGAQLPFGSLYFNATDNTDPATLLGYGTWTAFGQGRVILGVGTGTDSNAEDQTFAQGDTGGEYDHTLTISEMPAHTHKIAVKTPPSQETFAGDDVMRPDPTFATNNATSSTGGDGAHNNLQPYIAVYIWKRTA